MKKITLNGNTLKIKDLVYLVKNDSAEVEIDSQVFHFVNKTRVFLDENSKKEVIYGINTGFGPMASHIISKNQLQELQRNLIISHAVGVGDPILPEYVLAAMVIRLNGLLKGYSGASEELILRLQTFINKRIIPIVPEHGSVGTSGDLVQLAHISLSLLGEGQVYYQGKVRQTSDVIKELDIKPYELKSKEGLALINGTSVMTAIAALLCDKADTLLTLAIHTGAWSLEMVNGFSDSLSIVLHELRPHKGQKEVAEKMRSILSSSKLLQSRDEFNSKQVKVTDDTHQVSREVQDVYSLRCTPQILGPVMESIELTKKIVTTEINSVTDNPLIDVNNREFLHGGNFHGDYIAYAIDQLKMTIVKLTILSERRVNYFLNQKINKRFTPFINLKTPGLSLALQAFQFIATSTTSQSQTLAFPQYVHSISTNADNQDVVSMGTDATLLAAKVIENAFVVLTIEFLVLAQAVDFLKNENSISDNTRKIYKYVREVFPAIYDDRVTINEINKLLLVIKENIIEIIR